MIRSSNLQRKHCTLSAHTCMAINMHITKYTQLTTMYATTHNTKSTQRTATRYQLHT